MVALVVWRGKEVSGGAPPRDFVSGVRRYGVQFHWFAQGSDVRQSFSSLLACSDLWLGSRVLFFLIVFVILGVL